MDRGDFELGEGFVRLDGSLGSVFFVGVLDTMTGLRIAVVFFLASSSCSTSLRIFSAWISAAYSTYGPKAVR